MIRVLIVDDHPVVRSGLETMLGVEYDMEVVGAVEGGEAALEFCQHARPRPNLVVSDVHMPAGDGFELLGALRNFDPSIRVLLHAGTPLKEEAERAREDGAGGYLTKSSDGRRLLSAMRKLVAGEIDFVSDSFTASTGVITERELMILRYASEGKTREEIAIILGIGLETVKTHLRTIMSKLDTTNTTASVAKAFTLGLLRP